MLDWSNIFGKKAVFVSIITFLFIVNFGGFITANMMTSGSEMNNCPYLGVLSGCSMTPVEHLSLWQQMFTVTLQDIATFIFLVSVISFCYVCYCLYIPTLIGILIAPSRHRDKRDFFSYLQLAFARGIINSKAF